MTITVFKKYTTDIAYSLLCLSSISSDFNKCFAFKDVCSKLVMQTSKVSSPYFVFNPSNHFDTYGPTVNCEMLWNYQFC